jgi:hypothetical protein
LKFLLLDDKNLHMALCRGLSNSIVACLLKARIVKPEETAVAKERLQTCLLLGSGTTNASLRQCKNKGIPGSGVFCMVGHQANSNGTSDHVILSHTHQQSNHWERHFLSQGYITRTSFH